MMLEQHSPQYSLNILCPSWHRKKENSLWILFHHIIIQAFLFQIRNKNPLSFEELCNTTFAHRAEFKFHFLVENRNLYYCDDWIYQRFYVSKMLPCDITVVFQQREDRLQSKTTKWLHLIAVCPILIRNRETVKLKAGLNHESQKRTHCSCAHQSYLHSHYLHHISSAVGYIDDCHNGNLHKDCKSSPLQCREFANDTTHISILFG